jgi:glutathione S-transferase
MHSGFGALRSRFGMNIEARLPEVGARVLAEEPAARADVERVVALWEDALARPAARSSSAISRSPTRSSRRWSRGCRPTGSRPRGRRAYMERVLASPGVAPGCATPSRRRIRSFEKSYRTAR